MDDRPRPTHPLAVGLGLQPHPEGGWFRRTWVSDAVHADGRARASAILYLLAAGETSAWHRLTDADELWLYHQGAPLTLWTSRDGEELAEVTLGPDVLAGEQPQAVVPAGCWQSARSTGAHTLVSCSVVPEFRFEGFELAPTGWAPGRTPS